MSDAIRTEGLVKTFGRATALAGLDLTVTSGEVHGFLGPNGAGKTTTIRILLGLLRATGGRAEVLGHDPWADAVKLHHRIAYVPGDVSLWPNLSGGEAIDLLASLRGADLKKDLKSKQDLMERFQLDPSKRCRTYSKGNRQKVALIAAFASPKTDLFILDEPTSGLDPLMEAVFQEVVGEASGRGATMLLSSHIFAEVEALCSRVTIIRDGVTVETGTLAGLRHLARTSITVESSERIDGLDTLKGVHDLTTDGTRTTLDLEPEALPDVLKHLATAGVRSLTSRPPTLEELFMRHYGPQKQGAER
jgi:ABC-2 type transport system ATP-binding protein